MIKFKDFKKLIEEDTNILISLRENDGIIVSQAEAAKEVCKPTVFDEYVVSKVSTVCAEPQNIGQYGKICIVIVLEDGKGESEDEIQEIQENIR